MKERPARKSEISKKILLIILPFFIFCWPFIYLFRHVFPIYDQYSAIGNDFGYLYYKYKVYLLAHLADFSIPLWSPSEGAGFPFYSNPFAQAFYPLNFLLLIWYKLSGSYNPIDHQIYTVGGISIFALGLYLWLHKINSNIRAVIFSTLIMSISFKITELIRFPNAVHTAAWYPWILYSITGVMESRRPRQAILYGILLTFSLILLCTGGYPYFIYYSTFLLIPYVLTFLIKPLRLRLFGSVNINMKRSLIALISACMLSVFICGPYILSIKDLMSQTTDRAGKNFEYSTSHVFSFEDTIGSLFFPPSSQAEGWYFFSITAILIIFIYGIYSCQTNASSSANKANARQLSEHPYVILFFLLWFSTISYITYGKDSYLFLLLWKYLPGFSSLRTWGRLNIVLVPIIAWCLSYAYNSFETHISSDNHNKETKNLWGLSPFKIIAACYLFIIGIQYYFYHNKIYDAYWVHGFKHVTSCDIEFIQYGLLSFIVIMIITATIQYIQPKSGSCYSVILILLVLTAFLEMRNVGTNMWTYKGKILKNDIQLDSKQTYKASFQYPRVFQNTATISLTPTYNVNTIPNWYFDRYNKFLTKTESEQNCRDILLGVDGGIKVFIADSINHKTVLSFLKDSLRYQNTGRLISYSGDELNWEVNMKQDGFLCFIDNWEKGWKAFVDGKPAEIELLFGTFKSVRLNQGLHRVKFVYRPKVMY